MTPGAGAAADPSLFHGKSAASWPSIIAGAFVATSATLVLMTLGSGIGLASISPWHNHGVSVTTFAITGAIWLILTQWISAGLGGYIAGRLRTRWIGTHTHEVFFQGYRAWIHYLGGRNRAACRGVIKLHHDRRRCLGSRGR